MADHDTTRGPRLQRGEFGLLLLALLHEREMYGYELLAELRTRTDAVVDLPEGTIYPALRRLEQDGLIVGRWHSGTEAPRRRYYALTADGEAALDDGRIAWRKFVRASETVLGG
jgi:DNA-binding PadR family transcriptional regulator